MISGNKTKEIVRKILKFFLIFAYFAGRIRNRIKLRKRSESESRQKIAKRKRSEVDPILCEAKRCEFRDSNEHFCVSLLQYQGSKSDLKIARLG